MPTGASGEPTNTSALPESTHRRAADAETTDAEDCKRGAEAEEHDAEHEGEEEDWHKYLSAPSAVPAAGLHYVTGVCLNCCSHDSLVAPNCVLMQVTPHMSATVKAKRSLLTFAMTWAGDISLCAIAY